MTKTMIALLALTVATPAVAQTSTTNCRSVVFGQPQYGVTCDTMQQQVQPMRAPAQLHFDDGSAAADQSLRQRELALRERELRLREAEAGLASPAPQAGDRARSARRALFGF